MRTRARHGLNLPRPLRPGPFSGRVPSVLPSSSAPPSNSEGWALAFVKYSKRFTGEEERARSERLGLWQWRFDNPWDWRAGVLQQAVQTASERAGDCLIKGNISRSGERIYHMQFHQHYGRTRINKSQGERWFCTEDEALAAGWRRALR